MFVHSGVYMCNCAEMCVHVGVGAFKCVCTYGYVYVCGCARVCVYVYLCLHVLVCLCAHVCMHVCGCAFVCVQVRLCVRACLWPACLLGSANETLYNQCDQCTSWLEWRLVMNINSAFIARSSP